MKQFRRTESSAMSSLRPLIPLLIAAGFLLGGNGLQSTLIALRGAAEGFSPATIGFMGTTYFTGFLVGCFAITPIMKSVGHIRTFAALAAIAAVATLLLVLFIEPLVWSAVRFVTGLCFAGLFTVIESWLNAGVSNRDRGRVLSVYRIIDIGSVISAQFLIPAVGAGGFEIFALMTIMITLSLVPVSLADRSNPVAPDKVRLDIRRVWRISPLGAIGCMVVGTTNGAFRSLAPVYAGQIGMSLTDVVVFVSAGIAGGAVMQYPLGYLSDLWDRRLVMLVSVVGAMVSALALALFAGTGAATNLALVLVFGSFAMPLYSLAAAHANDRAGRSEFVQVSAVLMLFYSVGAIVGPLSASFFMQTWGPGFLFAFIACTYVVLLAAILVRMRAKPGVPADQRGSFVALLRTSPLFGWLVRRESRADHDKDGE